MKITFLVPPVLIGKIASERLSGCTLLLYPIPNIFELTSASVLERAGYEIAYVDAVLNKWGKSRFIKFIEKDQSDIYSIWTVDIAKKNDLETHRIIRECSPRSKVIFMGPAATYFVEEFTLDENTFVVRGEPEYTLLELVQALDSRRSISAIRGVSYKINNELKNNDFRDLIENLDELPFPARHLIDRNKYHNPKLKISPCTVVSTSRNCPYWCTYCAPPSLSFAREIEYKRFFKRKPPIRIRSVGNVLEELKMLSAEGYRAISFIDDTFTIDEKRSIGICEGLKRYNFAWGCQTRADKLNEGLVQTMAASGCVYVDLGVESFDQKILDYVKKNIRVEDNIAAIRLLKKHKISAKINVLLGCAPFETEKTVNHTIDMLNKLDADQIMLSVVTPHPVTELYETAKKMGWFVKGEYEPASVQHKAIINLPHLSHRRLERLILWYNLKFFIHPRFIKKHMFKFTSPREFLIAAKGLYTKLFGDRG